METLIKIGGIGHYPIYFIIEDTEQARNSQNPQARSSTKCHKACTGNISPAATYRMCEAEWKQVMGGAKRQGFRVRL